VGVGLGAGVGLGVGLGEVLVGAEVAAALPLAGDTPTPFPQPVRISPAATTAESERNAFRRLIVGMDRLKYGRLVRAICRSLGTYSDPKCDAGHLELPRVFN
jgi:hypothetical protein